MVAISLEIFVQNPAKRLQFIMTPCACVVALQTCCYTQRSLFQRVDSFACAQHTIRQRENSYARERKANRPTRKRDEIIFLCGKTVSLFAPVCHLRYARRRRRPRRLYLSMRTYIYA
uniref:Secreted protein n=1 Tax=Trichogramma kaykai TaxID=54128 RepID=A0ABD2X2Q8_9HYME